MHNLFGTIDTLEKYRITTRSYNQGDSNNAIGHNFFDCWRGKILTTLCCAATETKTEISCTVTGALRSKWTKNEWFLIEMAGIFQGKLVLGNACFQTGVCWRERCLNTFIVGENCWISFQKYFLSNIKKINFWAQNKVFFMLLIKTQLKSMPQQREKFGVNWNHLPASIQSYRTSCTALQL